MRTIVEALPIIGLVVAVAGLIWPKFLGGGRGNGVVIGIGLTIFSVIVGPSLRSEAEQMSDRIAREVAAADRDRRAAEARAERDHAAALAAAEAREAAARAEEERAAAARAAAAEAAQRRAQAEQERQVERRRAAEEAARRGPDTLRMPEGQAVMVWRSSEGQREALSLINAGVHRTNPALLMPYIACMAPSGTAVVVVDGGIFSSTILVREGRLSGCRGVVENEWISRPR